MQKSKFQQQDRRRSKMIIGSDSNTKNQAQALTKAVEEGGASAIPKMVKKPDMEHLLHVVEPIRTTERSNNPARLTTKSSQNKQTMRTATENTPRS